MSDQTALASRIHGYLEDLDKVVDRAIILATKAMKSGDLDPLVITQLPQDFTYVRFYLTGYYLPPVLWHKYNMIFAHPLCMR